MKYKASTNVVNASKLLLCTIIRNLGGSTEVGNRCGLKRQAIHNFEKFGYVPLIQAYSIAKDLKLKVWHISFYKLVEVLGHDAPHLETLIKKLSILTAEDKEKILKVLKK